jgi:glycosyltransferase involved in cell wall biosynthesis
LRVVILSKALVVGVYHSKLRELAALPDVELTAIVPPAWRDERGTLTLERGYDDGYQLLVTPIRFNGNFHLHYYPQLNTLLQQLQPDIVHIDEEPYNLATFLALQAARRAGARSVFFSWQNLNRLYPFPFSTIERYTLDHADACIAGSQDAAQVWRAKGYQGLIEVIPQFGVDPETFMPLARDRSTDSFVIGYVGRFVEEKGLDTLIQALARLDGSWRADFIGGGPLRGRLIELARRLKIETRVRIRPWLTSREVPDFYRSLDVLVLPSRSRSNWKEQFGRVLIEAMASGVAVIGSTCGEIPNVVGDAGLIFAEGDAGALCQQLSLLQHDTALRRRYECLGRQRVLEHFTQTQVARETYGVYRRLLAHSLRAA